MKSSSVCVDVHFEGNSVYSNLSVILALYMAQWPRGELHVDRLSKYCVCISTVTGNAF